VFGPIALFQGAASGVSAQEFLPQEFLLNPWGACELSGVFASFIFRKK